MCMSRILNLVKQEYRFHIFSKTNVDIPIIEGMSPACVIKPLRWEHLVCHVPLQKVSLWIHKEMTSF